MTHVVQQFEEFQWRLEWLREPLQVANMQVVNGVWEAGLRPPRDFHVEFVLTDAKRTDSVAWMTVECGNPCWSAVAKMVVPIRTSGATGKNRLDGVQGPSPPVGCGTVARMKTMIPHFAIIKMHVEPAPRICCLFWSTWATWPSWNLIRIAILLDNVWMDFLRHFGVLISLFLGSLGPNTPWDYHVFVATFNGAPRASSGSRTRKTSRTVDMTVRIGGGVFYPFPYLGKTNFKSIYFCQVQH